jgi:peptide/nickel transport system permease protein
MPGSPVRRALPIRLTRRRPPAENEAEPGPAVTVGADERIAVASQRQLIWWRFRRHKLAMASAIILIGFYLVALFADFFAYADPQDSNGSRTLMPPQRVYIFDGLSISPHIHPVVGYRDPVTFEKTYAVDTSQNVSVDFFAKGYKYKLFGFIPTDIHLLGVSDGRAGDTLALLGTDEQGRDIYSRLMIATRTSMTIGLVGVSLSLVFGSILGGISGYYGGFIDTVIQRLIEVIRSVPTIPLWMGLAAAMPRDWSVTKVYFCITLIVSLIGWTELARVVRGRFLQIRNEDFVTAAELVGARPRRVIVKHMLPLFSSHIIAATTLALPDMIVAETSLSFLGLGLREPAVSWGVMLQQAQNIQSIALTPWMLAPVVPVIVAILAFNFVGDGLRDAADPYGD